MAIKRVCDRCGDVTNSHKIYFGRFLAMDWFMPGSSPNWRKKTKQVCFKCYKEFENWFTD